MTTASSQHAARHAGYAQAEPGGHGGHGLPLRCGVGLKPEHFRDLFEGPHNPAFIEVHAENYLVDGGPMHRWLARAREKCPLSLHGVGLSIAGAGPVDEEHLSRIAALVERYEPAQFSEHLAWSSHGGVYFNDLLPARYDEQTLARVCRNIDRIQRRMHRRILIENPSTYVAFASTPRDEADFISEVVRATGCGLLLDLTNVHVSCTNHDREPLEYLQALPLDQVGEVHLAGCSADRGSSSSLLIDDHGSRVPAPVWELYEWLIDRVGQVPTLIEWDNDVPGLQRLLLEAQRADAIAYRSRVCEPC